MVDMAASGEVAQFRKSMQKSINSNGSDKSKPASRGKPNDIDLSEEERPFSGDSQRSKSNKVASPVADEKALKRKLKEQKAQEAEEERKIIVRMKLTDERTKQREERIIDILKERTEKKDTPSFRAEYFQSFAGQGYLAVNPPEPPSEEVLLRMK